MGFFYKENHDIFIKTTRYSSDFTWNFGKYTKKQHTHSCIPEIEVTSTCSKCPTFTTVVNIFTKTQNQVYNANKIEDDIYSDDSDVPNSKLSDNAYTNPNSIYTEADSSASIIPEFVERNTFIYFRYIYEEIATLLSITCSDSNFNYLITLPNETVITTTLFFLQPAGEQDNTILPSTLNDYKIS